MGPRRGPRAALVPAAVLAIVAALIAVGLRWSADDDGVHLDAVSLPVSPATTIGSPPPDPSIPTFTPSPPTLAPVGADANGTTPSDGGAPATGEAASSSPAPGATAAGPDPAGAGPGGANQAAGAPAPAASPTSTTPPPTAPVGGDGAWRGEQRPFASSSSWNTPIPGGANFTDIAMPAASGGNYWVDWEEYSLAVWQSQPGDPLVAVSHPSGWGFPANSTQLRLRAGITGAAGSDGSIVVVDGARVYNLWQFHRTGDTTATAEASASTDVTTGTGWGFAAAGSKTGAGITAVGSSQLAGLLVEAEANAGEIRHALQLSVDGRLNRPGAVGEALRSDGQAADGIVHQGQRLAIPPTVPMPAGLSPLGQKVFRALQTYGAFDVDSSGGSTTLRAQSNAFDPATIDALRQDMKALGPLLEAVDW